MEDRLCSQYFLAPEQTTQRRYEALRALFVTGEPLAIVAQRFGYKVSALKSMACRFRAECRGGSTPPFSYPMAAGGFPGPAVVATTTGRNCPRSPTAENGTSRRGERFAPAWPAFSSSCPCWRSWASTAWSSRPSIPDRRWSPHRPRCCRSWR